jgi:hypothetical protein
MGVAPLTCCDIFRSCRISNREFTLPRSSPDKFLKFTRSQRMLIIVKIQKIFYLLIIFLLFDALYLKLQMCIYSVISHTQHAQQQANCTRFLVTSFDSLSSHHQQSPVAAVRRHTDLTDTAQYHAINIYTRSASHLKHTLR